MAALSVFLLGLDQLLAGASTLTDRLDWLGRGVLLLVSLYIATLGLAMLHPDLLKRTSRAVLLGTLALIGLLVVKLTHYGLTCTGAFADTLVPFMLPLALAPLLATLLLDGLAGLTIGLWVACAASIGTDGGLIVFLNGLLTGTICAAFGHRARTRTRVVRIGLVAGLAQILCVLGVTALRAGDTSPALVLNQAAACLCSGFVAAVLALLILPLFESVFRITSDISMLELSDLSHPLLQRLALEAPGTYHHSLVVASLAQAAAEAIGANSLQARVCAYFHDIGKLSKPEFFTENIRHNHNPHDRLAPSMSALIVTAHVKEGVSLALLHKLPRNVMDAIREHHGTSLVSYFHRKALAQQAHARTDSEADPADHVVDEWHFRYPGPKPSSAITAILALADPIEAASRSLEKVTPHHVETLVDTVVNVRLEDGQLDQAPLTLAQLSTIKRTFVFTLTNMLHGRTPYPSHEDRHQQPAAELPREPGRAAIPDDVFDG